MIIYLLCFRSGVEVTGETELFQKEMLGKTPHGCVRMFNIIITTSFPLFLCIDNKFMSLQRKCVCVLTISDNK